MSKTAKAVGAGPRPTGGASRGAATAKRPPGGQVRVTKAMARRHVREQRMLRVLYVMGGLVVLALAVAGFGYFYENIWRANEPIASVYGKPITTVEYAKVLGFKQTLLDNQQQQFEQMMQQPSDPNNPQSGFMAQIAQQQLSSIRQQRGELEGKTVEDMMNAELMRVEAKKRGLSATQDEINNAIVDELGTRAPQPTPTPTTGEDGQQAAVPTPAPTPPATADEIQKARDQMTNTLKQLKLLSEQEFIAWIIEPKVLEKKLNDAMADGTPRTAEQVHARHILVDTQDDAQKVIDRLNAGEDFAAVAAEVSKDNSNKDQGGDLGWFPRGQMVKEFDTIAFSLPINDLSRPVKTQFGYHVIQVLEKGDRELTDEQYATAKKGALDRWLEAQRSDAPNTVAYYISSTRTFWARDYINRNLNKKVYGG